MKVIANTYSTHILTVRKVDKVALAMKVDGVFTVKLYDAEYVCKRIDVNAEKLLRHHDGVRLQEIDVRTSGTCRNMAMRALATQEAAETLFTCAKRVGDRALEKLIAKQLGGKWLGGLSNHACDILLRDGTRIEVKGMGGAWHLEYDANGKVKDSNWTRNNNPAEYHMNQLLANWDNFTDEPTDEEFDD